MEPNEKLSVNDSCRFCSFTLRLNGTITNSRLIFDSKDKDNVCGQLSKLGLVIENTAFRSCRVCRRCYATVIRLVRDTEVLEKWKNAEREIEVEIETETETERETCPVEEDSSADEGDREHMEAPPPAKRSRKSTKMPSRSSVTKKLFLPRFKDILHRCSQPCRAVGHYHCPNCPQTVIRRVDMERHLAFCQLTDGAAPYNGFRPEKLFLPRFKDMLHRCSQPCRPVGHYHCPDCPQTVIRRVDMERHLAFCRLTHGAAPDLLPAQPDLHIALDHTYPLSQTHPPKKPRKVKCRHCPLIVCRKNVTRHEQRKHGQQKDVSAESHLKGTCVDPNKGLYAVRKTFRRFSVPIHVQQKTWGQQQVTRCEMEDCLSHSTCHHIRSLKYCDTTATEEPLQEQVLNDMINHHFFSAAKVSVCKTRQKEAEDARAPLCVLLELGGSINKHFLSVYEPSLHHYSPLGRVVVTHNKTKNSWHCPCVKPRTSCPHKHIAKWYLFQTDKDMFKTATQSTASPVTTSLTAEMERTVRSKKIPATLPEEVTSPRQYPQAVVSC